MCEEFAVLKLQACPPFFQTVSTGRCKLCGTNFGKVPKVSENNVLPALPFMELYFCQKTANNLLPFMQIELDSQVHKGAIIQASASLLSCS